MALSNSTTSDLLRALTEARAACPDCSPPARQMHPDDNPPVPCQYCGTLTYARINRGGVCGNCLSAAPRLIADFNERMRTGRI